MALFLAVFGENGPFFVVPLPSNGFDPKTHGIKTGWSGYGSVGAIIYNGKMIYAPYADAGPTGVIGELSYRAAELLGIPPSPINGGVASLRVNVPADPGLQSRMGGCECSGASRP